MSRALRLMALLSALLFITLAVISRLWLEPEGFRIFDSQLAGYSVAEARDYLRALDGIGGTDLYLGAFRQIDTVFPILLALTIAGFIWHQGRGLSLPLRILVSLSPAVYLLLDLRENAQVALLLRTGPQVSESAILTASTYTMGKWISLSIALLLAVWAWRLVPKDRHAR